MGEYITKKEDMKFQSQDALKPVQAVIDEADKVLNDKSLRIEDSAISGALTGALGAGAGGALGFAGLYFGGSVVGLSAAGITSGLAAAGSLVGGGMAAGLAVLAAPAVALGVIGAAIGAASEDEKLREAKNLMYQNALKKQTAILKALKEEADADKERIKYLTGLNTLLEAAIKDLEHDLGVA